MAITFSLTINPNFKLKIVYGLNNICYFFAKVVQFDKRRGYLKSRTTRFNGAKSLFIDFLRKMTYRAVRKYHITLGSSAVATGGLERTMPP